MTREVIPIPLDDLEEVYEAVEVAKRNTPSTVMEVAQRAVERVAGWSTAKQEFAHRVERWMGVPGVKEALHRKPDRLQ